MLKPTIASARGPRIDWEGLARNLGYSSEKEMWETLYLLQGSSLEQLANRFGVSFSGVRDAVRRCGVPLRRRGGAHRTMKIPKGFFEFLREHTIAETADHFGMSQQSVYSRLNRLEEQLVGSEVLGNRSGRGDR